MGEAVHVERSSKAAVRQGAAAFFVGAVLFLRKHRCVKMRAEFISASLCFASCGGALWRNADEGAYAMSREAEVFACSSRTTNLQIFVIGTIIKRHRTLFVLQARYFRWEDDK